MLLLKSNLSSIVAGTRVLIRETFCRTYYKKPFSYDDRYSGKFDYHNRNLYPKKMNPYKEEELLEEVHAIKALSLENPSPFHVVRRIRSMAHLPWFQKVTLRRLNLHSQYNGDSAIVPNTPQFNALLIKVKHVIQLKPAKFADGRIPQEEDIGALKVCPYTGTIKIDEKLRLQEKRLNLEKPPLFQGNHLRGHISRLMGIHHNYPVRV